MTRFRIVRRPSPGPADDKPPRVGHWNAGPDLAYGQQHAYYHPVTVPSLPPLSASAGPPPSQLAGIWPPRQPNFGDFITGLNPLSGIPPLWHQDPSAMAWIASRHVMLPPTLANQAHAHSYGMPLANVRPDHVNGSLSNGNHPSGLYSPNSSGTLLPSEDSTYPCELCGKTFTAKETLRQVKLTVINHGPICLF